MKFYRKREVMIGENVKERPRSYTITRPAAPGWWDRVWYTGYIVDEVRQSLIEHDHYLQDIVVRRDSERRSHD